MILYDFNYKVKGEIVIRARNACEAQLKAANIATDLSWTMNQVNLKLQMSLTRVAKGAQVSDRAEIPGIPIPKAYHPDRRFAERPVPAPYVGMEI